MVRSEPARILIVDDDVDDDADIRANLCDILEMFGYEPANVGTSGDALQFPNLQDVSVILLDRRLPDLRAEEALPLLRERVPDTDVVIVTGHADLDSTIAALRLGAADYLLKPINPEALHLDRTLYRRQAVAPREATYRCRVPTTRRIGRQRHHIHSTRPFSGVFESVCREPLWHVGEELR